MDKELAAMVLAAILVVLTGYFAWSSAWQTVPTSIFSSVISAILFYYFGYKAGIRKSKGVCKVGN